MTPSPPKKGERTETDRCAGRLDSIRPARPRAPPGGRGWHPSAGSSARGVPPWGDRRALDALVNRVHGKPTEHVVTEPQGSRLDRFFDNMSTEELEEFVRNTRHSRQLRAVHDQPDEEAV